MWARKEILPPQRLEHRRAAKNPTECRCKSGNYCAVQADFRISLTLCRLQRQSKLFGSSTKLSVSLTWKAARNRPKRARPKMNTFTGPGANSWELSSLRGHIVANQGPLSKLFSGEIERPKKDLRGTAEAQQRSQQVRMPCSHNFPDVTANVGPITSSRHHSPSARVHAKV